MTVPVKHRQGEVMSLCMYMLYLEVNISERKKKTAYSLLVAEFHGQNGLKQDIKGPYMYDLCSADSHIRSGVAVPK